MDFYTAKGKMQSLLTGDIALDSLEIEEDRYLKERHNDVLYYLQEDDNPKPIHPIPPGEDIKWICGDCGATDWTPNNCRCKYCRD